LRQQKILTITGWCAHLSPTCTGPPLPILNQLGSLPAHVPSDARALPEGWRTLPEQVGGWVGTEAHAGCGDLVTRRLQ
jgi:hypothetical protein